MERDFFFSYFRFREQKQRERFSELTTDLAAPWPAEATRPASSPSRAGSCPAGCAWPVGEEEGAAAALTVEETSTSRSTSRPVFFFDEF